MSNEVVQSEGGQLKKTCIPVKVKKRTKEKLSNVLYVYFLHFSTSPFQCPHDQLPRRAFFEHSKAKILREKQERSYREETILRSGWTDNVLHVHFLEHSKHLFSTLLNLIAFSNLVA